MTIQRKHSKSLRPASCILHPLGGFTLVELLVVIAIIGILAALITVAAAGALKTARQNQIKTECDQIHAALETYKDTYGSFPPNCQTDDTSTTETTPNAEPSTAPIFELQVFSDLKRHMKQAFPQHREDENLLRVLCGLPALTQLPNAANYQRELPGGMTAGEALVFWLGGFSADPQYPISGEGGPAYRTDNISVSANQADPLESRKWVYPFDVPRLRPRGGDGYFDENSTRFIEFVGQDGNDYRINFWQYVPPRLTQPYVYFDTSRHPAGVNSSGNTSGPFLAPYDPPAATASTGTAVHVHAVKRRSESANSDVPIQFATPDKFQILHAGLDDAWGEAAFERMSLHDTPPDNLLIFPDGPFTGEVADTIANFSEGTLEQSQP